MKKVIYILNLLFLLMTTEGFAQTDQFQEVHQYICREGYQTLTKINSNYRNIEMADWIGSGSTVGPWSFEDKERVVAGAWQEDQFDEIWRQSCYLLDYTQTHFWQQNNPEIPAGSFNVGDCDFYCNPSNNAWNRIEAYKNGGWELVKPYPGTYTVYLEQYYHPGEYYLIESPINISFQYEGLVEGERNLYQTGYVRIIKYQLRDWSWHYPENWEVKLTANQNKYFSYEILGRMAHCLQDMATPAHAHLDGHPDLWWCRHSDSYETRMRLYTFLFRHDNVPYPAYIDPIIPVQGWNYHPLFWLSFTQLQVAGHFPSNDCNPWSYYSNPPFEIVNDIVAGSPNLGNNIFGGEYGPDAISQSNFIAIGNYCMKTSIRTTAGLFYWFAYKTGQVPGQPIVPPPGTISIQSHDMPRIQGTNTFTLYRPRYGTLTATSSNANAFEWLYQFCFDGDWHSELNHEYGLNLETVNYLNSITLHNESFNNEDCPPTRGPSKITLNWNVWAFNNYGQNVFSNIIVVPSAFQPPSGCPWIVVDTGNGLVAENNILHRSELSENQGIDIRDLYKLKSKPSIEHDTIFIQVIEMNNDVSYFDQFKMYDVEHPQGTMIAITENNEIVMFDSVSVFNTDYANLNDTDITENVLFHEPPKGPLVAGDTLDHIYSHFEQRELFNAGIIMQLEGGIIIHPYPMPKPADHVTINTESGNTDAYFSHRENPTITVIPIQSLGGGVVVNSADVDWTRNFKIRYVALTSYTTEGFTLTEIPLVEAKHTVYGDVLSSLLNNDSVHVEMDTTAIIALKFNSARIKMGGGTSVHDYIFETTGRYVKAGEGNIFNLPLHVVNKNVNPIQYKLYINYPNPFNPKTTIKYDIAKAGMVKIEVYDILGRLVATLVNDYRTPGNYNVSFDGSNLASGVYIYKLQSGNFTDVKKMVLIK